MVHLKFVFLFLRESQNPETSPLSVNTTLHIFKTSISKSIAISFGDKLHMAICVQSSEKSEQQTYKCILHNKTPTNIQLGNIIQLHAPNIIYKMCTSSLSIKKYNKVFFFNLNTLFIYLKSKYFYFSFKYIYR